MSSTDALDNRLQSAIRFDQLWGTEPPYTAGKEDNANLFQQLYYGWIGDFIYKAAEGNITEDDLPPPTRKNRAYNIGRRLSRQLHEDVAKKKRWDAFIGCPVRYKEEMETYGILRYVGYLRQSDHPRRLLAGVEWGIAPRYRRSNPLEGAELHNGTVHGEVLFTPTKENCSSLEGVKDILILTKDGRPPPPPPLTLNVLKSLFTCHRKHILGQFFPRILSDACGLAIPVLIENFVNFLNNENSSWYKGVLLSFLFFLASVVQSCAAHKYDHISIRAASVYEIATQTTVFEKCLTSCRKTFALPEMSIGRIANMAANDVENVGDLNWYVVYFITSPIQLIVCLLMLFRLVGWAAVGGIVVLIVSFSVQSVLYKYQQKIREKLSSVIDTRLKKTNEFLSGIRIVKFMGWEPRFIYIIEKTREQEIDLLRQLHWTYIGNMVVDRSTPVLVISLVFVLFHLSGNVLTAETVFPVISLLNIMEVPFFLIPAIVGALISCLVSARRLSVFLECDDYEEEPVKDISDIFKGGVAAAFDETTVFSYVPRTLPKYGSRTKSTFKAIWNSIYNNTIPETEFIPVPEEEPTEEKEAPIADDDDSHLHQLTTKSILKNLNVIIPKGKLTMVVGATGSGKSTFIASLLGEYGVSRGSIYGMPHQMVYVPQQPWIMNASLKDNIVFFQEEDLSKLDSVVRDCQLETDIKLLSSGLETEIGEKGINLSGGQKARVNLARAVYADREMYLLDDPLSALDAHVGERVMNEVILGRLKEKTRVLATHQIQLLPKADYIIEIKKGRVVFSGEYTDYINDTARTKEVEESSDDESDKEGEYNEAHGKDGEDAGKEDAGKGGESDGKLITTEEKAIGSVPWSTYLEYVRNSGGTKMWLLLLLIYSVGELFTVSTVVWLSLWATDAFGLTANQYILIYLGLVALTIISEPLRGYYSYLCMRTGSENLHRQLLRSVGVGTVEFFDTTPLGRLLNRFSRDINNIDEDLGDSLMYCVSYVLAVISTIVVMSVAQPMILLAVVLCGFFYYKLMKLYNSSNRETRRIKSIAHSPVFTLLEETMSGKTTIKTFEKAPVIMKLALKRLDVVYKALYMQNIANRWLGTRLEFISACVITLVALIGVVGKIASFSTHSVALVALSLTNAVTLTETLNWLVRQTASVEANMNSMERIHHYIHQVDHEDMPTLSEDIQNLSSTTAPKAGSCSDVVVVGSPTNPVPQHIVAGSLEFRDVQMRYREGLPLVLNHVNFVITPREKVGIVGRTGSGKSTLLLTFMRMVDICGGEILVNGKPIRSLPLRDLRRQFSMIPQDPVLFDGTVRMNVDPFLEASSEEVWAALETVGLKDRIAAEAEGIDGRVLEGGSNFSVGQRQLLCMARALLKKGSGFILMDEATANIDQTLDRHIQGTVMSAFAEYTVITIAHRLQTVAQYDKIIVMDHGVVAEMGSPRELVSNPNSVFRKMVEAGGEEAVDTFLGMTQQP